MVKKTEIVQYDYNIQGIMEYRPGELKTPAGDNVTLLVLNTFGELIQLDLGNNNTTNIVRTYQVITGNAVADDRNREINGNISFAYRKKEVLHAGTSDVSAGVLNLHCQVCADIAWAKDGMLPKKLRALEFIF